MEALTDFIRPELLILIPALYVLGVGLRRSKKFPDALIPATLGGVGVILALVWVLSVSPLSDWQSVLAAIFTGIVQGILCAGCAVYIHQLGKQAIKGD